MAKSVTLSSISLILRAFPSLPNPTIWTPAKNGRFYAGDVEVVYMHLTSQGPPQTRDLVVDNYVGDVG